MPTLFSAEVCPFAQRTRALLAELQEPFDLREIDLTAKPDDFVALSPTGKVPLYVDGDLKLYESAVINEYLAELHGWDAAWPADPAHRARQRLAMKQLDAVVIPVLYAGSRDPDQVEQKAAAVHAELDEVARTIEVTRPALPSLFAFHVAPFWGRFDALRPITDVAGLVDAHPVVRDFFDRAVALDPIGATLPSKEFLLDRYSRYFERK